MTALPSYPTYKDSGVEWLGDVPEHWEVQRMATVADLRVSNVDKHVREGESPVRLCNYLDVYHNERIGAHLPFMAGTAKEREIRKFRLAVGDVLITKDSEDWSDIGVPALVEYAAPDLVCGYHLAMLRPHGASLDGGYLFQALKDSHVAWQWQVAAAGVTRYGLSQNAIRSMKVPLPPLPEQRSVARFLNDADRRIRRYIRAKERLIELLEEERRATIHEAVTGRIDVRTGQPYPAYKDSGVEWLGVIPNHWVRCRLRNVVSEVTTGSRGWSSYASDEGPLFVRVANLSRGSLELRLEDAVRLDLPVTSEAARTRIAEGDLLLSVTAYIGSVGVAPEGLGEAYVSQHVARCRPSPAVESKWLGYVLLSSLGQTYGQTRLYGGTKDGLSLDDVRNYPILLPSREKQRELVRWIERRLFRLERRGDATRRQIALLREYRTRLIADVVTGKLDVREVAAKLPETDPLADARDRPGTIPTEPNPHASEHDMAKEARA